MLLYSNRSFWRLVLERRGSIVYQWSTVLAASVIGLATAGLQVLSLQNSPWAPHLPHHLGIHSLGAIVAFAVVFRTNLGWQRYWEATTQLHFMYSKWADAYSQFIAFAQVTLDQTKATGGEAAAAKIHRIRKSIKSIDHYFSLLSAVAADRLAHGDSQRMDRRAFVAQWSEQVILRRELRNGPDLTGARKLPDLKSRNFGHSQSLVSEWKAEYLVTSMPSGEERNLLENSSDRVSSVMFWILREMSAVSKDLDVAPPIQSRMYQECSNGMLGFNNCMKIADVPFPFPYAQLLTMLLTVYALFIPVYIAVFTESLIASPILAFLLFQGIWGVNEVAKELENPFGSDDNDLSLPDFHSRFLDVIWDVTPEGRESTLADFMADWGPEEMAKDTEHKDVSVVASAQSTVLPKSTLGDIAEARSRSVSDAPPGSNSIANSIGTGTARGRLVPEVASVRSAVAAPPTLQSPRAPPQPQEGSLLHKLAPSMPPVKPIGEVGETGFEAGAASPACAFHEDMALVEPTSNQGWSAVEVIDQTSKLIHERMEQHLAHIAQDLERLTGMVNTRLNASGARSIGSFDV